MTHLALATRLSSMLRVRSTFRRGMWTTELRMNVDPETVWSVITDVQSWPRWGPTVSAARVDGDSGLAVGARGTVTTAVGLSLPFEITDFVERRLWAWKVAGVGATRHEVIEVPGWLCPELRCSGLGGGVSAGACCRTAAHRTDLGRTSSPGRGRLRWGRGVRSRAATCDRSAVGIPAREAPRS